MPHNDFVKPFDWQVGTSGTDCAAHFVASRIHPPHTFLVIPVTALKTQGFSHSARTILEGIS